MVERTLRQTSHERRLNRGGPTIHIFYPCHIVRSDVRGGTGEPANDIDVTSACILAAWREHVPSRREGGVSFSVQRISSFPLAVSAEWPPTRVGHLLEDGYVPRQNLDFRDTFESSGFVKNKSPLMEYRRDQVKYSILEIIPWHFNSWRCMGPDDFFMLKKWRQV